MAPSKNDTYIWIALGLGGLYLLSRNDDDKSVHVKVEVKPPTTDFGAGAVGGTKREMPDDHGKRQQKEEPIHDNFDSEPLKKVNKPGAGDGGSLDVRFKAFGERITRLDVKVGKVYRMFNRQQSRAKGTLTPGMIEGMKKLMQEMIDLQTDIELFIREPGVPGTQAGYDLALVSENLAALTRDFDTALQMHTSNAEKGHAALTAKAFLRLYADVRRRIRDQRMKQQFLQQLDEDEDRDQDDLSDISESDTEGGGELNNTHTDDGKFRVKKRAGKKPIGYNPNFNTGEPSAHGMTQEEIESNTRTTTFGTSDVKLEADLDPDNDMSEAIGQSENVDTEHPNNTSVTAKLEETPPEKPKRKGPVSSLEKIGALTFNTAKPEQQTAATTINIKGGNMQRVKGHVKHVADSESARASLGGGRPTKTTVFKKGGKKKPGKGKRKAKLMETDGTVEDAFGANPSPGPSVNKPITQSSKPDPVDAIGKWVSETLTPDLLGQDADRDAIWSYIKKIWAKANLTYESAGKEPRKKRIAGETLVELGRSLANMTFGDKRKNVIFQTAKAIYGGGMHRSPFGGTDTMSNVALVAQLQQNTDRADLAFQIAAVWAYFAAAYNDITKNAARFGAKLLFSDKEDLYQDPALQPPEKKRKKPASVVDLTSDDYIPFEEQESSDISSDPETTPEPEQPPGRRLGHIIRKWPQPDKVPLPHMFGRGNRSRIDLDGNPLQ